MSLLIRLGRGLQGFMSGGIGAKVLQATLTSSGNFSTTGIEADIVVVGGGGAGASGSGPSGGGGGSSGKVSFGTLTISSPQPYTVGGSGGTTTFGPVSAPGGAAASGTSGGTGAPGAAGGAGAGIGGGENGNPGGTGGRVTSSSPNVNGVASGFPAPLSGPGVSNNGTPGNPGGTGSPSGTAFPLSPVAQVFFLRGGGGGGGGGTQEGNPEDPGIPSGGDPNGGTGVAYRGGLPGVQVNAAPGGVGANYGAGGGGGGGTRPGAPAAGTGGSGASGVIYVYYGT